MLILNPTKTEALSRMPNPNFASTALSLETNNSVKLSPNIQRVGLTGWLVWASLRRNREFRCQILYLIGFGPLGLLGFICFLV
ncbi:hypothetical protein F0562_002687 [Nyssa sinensis]|uniref:Uncharacterized protein n=1 Tax=Nyssa sinensis TaxID=561372 RepID=A0A5J5BVB9_9ASTE|nr:hypothetical protein F0562_002687 [Nyssa sinensis]